MDTIEKCDVILRKYYEHFNKKSPYGSGIHYPGPGQGFKYTEGRISEAYKRKKLKLRQEMIDRCRKDMHSNEFWAVIRKRDSLPYEFKE